MYSVTFPQLGTLIVGQPLQLNTDDHLADFFTGWSEGKFCWRYWPGLNLAHYWIKSLVLLPMLGKYTLDLRNALFLIRPR